MSSPNLAFPHIAAGQNSKEVTHNEFVDRVDSLFASSLDVDCTAGGTVVVLMSEFQDHAIFRLTGTPAAAFTVELPALTRQLVIENVSGQTATIRSQTGAGNTVDMSNADRAHLIALATGEEVQRIALSTIGGEPWDLSIFVPGTPSASALIARLIVPRAGSFPVNLVGSFATAEVAATATSTFDVLKNGVVQGTIEFAAASATGAFSLASGLSLVGGDVLAIQAPATPDASLSDISFTLAGSR